MGSEAENDDSKLSLRFAQKLYVSKNTPYEAEFIFLGLRMTLESRRDLPENGTLQKIPPYEAEFIFAGLRMTKDSRQDLPENGTLQKNTPLRSGIYFPRPQNDSRQWTRFGQKRYASKKYPPTKWNLFSVTSE